MDTTDMQAIAMVWLYLLLSYLLIVACIQLGSLSRVNLLPKPALLLKKVKP